MAVEDAPTASAAVVPEVASEPLAPAAPISPSPESAPVSAASEAIPTQAQDAAPVAGAEQPKAPEVKPTDAKAEVKVEEKPGEEPEAKPEDAPVEAPKPSYEFKMPEGVAADEPVLNAYSNILGKYAITPEAGQELLDFHAAQIKQAVTQIEQKQRDAFSDTRREWVGRVDKEFGNRRDTTIESAKWAVSEFGGDKKQVAELWSVLAFTGAGDHPAIIRWAANIAKKTRERSAPPQGVPRSGAKAAPWEQRYAKS